MSSRCYLILRSISRNASVKHSTRSTAHSRWMASISSGEVQPSGTTSLEGAPKTSVDPSITRIVDDISKLTLLQAAELVTELKTRLNIQEIAMPAMTAAPAAAAAPTEEPEAEKPKEKTIFTVHLEAFEDGAKAKVIKEVKAMIPGLTLMDAKKFVESVPKVLKENIPKEEAEKLQATFKTLGATVKLE